MKRKNPLKTHLCLSPTKKQQFEIIKKATRVKAQAIKRYKVRCEKIKTEIHTIQDEINKITASSLEDSLKKHKEKYDIPHHQVPNFH